MEHEMATSSVVVAEGANSGLAINLHPLAILNISDHYTRSKLTSIEKDPKLVGVLLGQQTGREVSIVNSFELVYFDNHDIKLDEEFFTTRREQFSQVFPTQSVVGWYSVGSTPTAQDVAIHAQVVASDAGPGVFVLFNPDIPEDAQALPFTVYESALTEGADGDGKFVQLEVGVETGEAERIAVDGITKEVGGDGDTSGQVGSLTMQRNAIAMLYNRIVVLVKYISGVIDGTATVDHDILRQIAALVATLPVMDATEFKAELSTEYNDVQLTDYLTTLLRQLEAFSDYTDKHLALHPAQSEEGPGRGFKHFGGIKSSMGGGSGRRQRRHHR